MSIKRIPAASDLRFEIFPFPIFGVIRKACFKRVLRNVANNFFKFFIIYIIVTVKKHIKRDEREEFNILLKKGF